ncbi:MAG: hypothetical protein U0790_05205 [Isosphaeraceae bacterium]
MLRWLYRRRIDAFDREFGYDSTYVREILEEDLGAAMKLARILPMTEYRGGLPKAAWYTAKLVGAVAEDCGPCTQLVVNMAEKAGVSPSLLRAVLEGDVNALPEDAALAYRFAQAVIRRDGEDEALRDRVVAAWGKRGLIALGFALTMARFFPTLKYALGHGQVCSRVKVGQTVVSVNHGQPA